MSVKLNVGLTCGEKLKAPFELLLSRFGVPPNRNGVCIKQIYFTSSIILMKKKMRQLTVPALPVLVVFGPDALNWNPVFSFLLCGSSLSVPLPNGLPTLLAVRGVPPNGDWPPNAFVDPNAGNLLSVLLPAKFGFCPNTDGELLTLPKMFGVGVGVLKPLGVPLKGGAGCGIC